MVMATGVGMCKYKMIKAVTLPASQTGQDALIILQAV